MKKNILQVASFSETGNKRKRNEDAIFVNPSAGLYGVCDGMGGLKFGKETAEMVARYFTVKEVKARHEGNGNVNYVNGVYAEQLKACIADIDSKAGFNNYDWYVRYGCTLCGMWFTNPNQAWVFNLGDSRCYHYHHQEKVLECVTTDHNLCCNQDSPHGEKYIKKNVLTKYIGKLYENEPDIFPVVFKNKDSFLICTDGLYGEVSEKDIESVLYNHEVKDIYKAGSALMKKALDNGGKDNISFLIIEPSEEECT